MSEREPPEWNRTDPLSSFFADAVYNERVTSLNFAPAFALLQKAHGLFRRLEEGIEKDNRVELLLPRFFMVRVHSSFLAGIRLAMSGQALESLPVLRAGVEQAWYCLHIAKDPSPPARATIWLNRNECAEDKKTCIREFSVGQIRATHEALDAATAKSLHEAYECLIDYGAHPNQFGVLTALTRSDVEDRSTFSVGILAPKPIQVLFALRMAMALALGSLKVFQKVYEERCALLGLDRDTVDLVAEANTLFKSYGSRFKKEKSGNTE